MLLCPLACGRPSRPLPALMKRIVGGRSAEPGLFPWQVLLSVEDLSRVPEDRWFGSGALLSQSWVLTAAHVLRSQRRDTSVVAVAPKHVKVGRPPPGPGVTAGLTSAAPAGVPWSP